MDQFLADLHVHSRYSRATSKSLTPRNLAAWAAVKGLHVLASGDFTHPGWLGELKDSLAPDGSGLFRLREPAGLASELPWLSGFALPGRTKFMLSAEISSIYKRGGKVRKVHNLVYLPSFDAVDNFNRKLAKIGNLESDGRPILGLDSRHLLEIVLETDPLAFLVPAHIWTPWFSLFGSKSGFDSVEECFGQLAGEIFALETGLSSDPEMNWLISSLDRFRLISNSDAHSGEKLGREANLFSGELSYGGIFRALRGEGVGCNFLGTVEFFPEEGKYHLDGHRECGVVMDPHQSRSRGGLCPVCGKPLTIGVLSRVLELADRENPHQPPDRPGFVSLIPLSEIIGEILGCGTGTKKVQILLAKLLGQFGPELFILKQVPLEELGRVNRPLAEAISRMRRGQVLREPGFDGQFGRIKLFAPEELKDVQRSGRLVPSPAKSAANAQAGSTAPEPAPQSEPEPEPVPQFNTAQKRAVESRHPHLLVLAGPGTGKTHTLVGKAAYLLASGTPPELILAITFTRRAAAELRQRLAGQPGAESLRADTLHALAFELWTEEYGEKPVLLSEDAARRLFAEVNPELSGVKLKNAWQSLQLAREKMRELGPADDVSGLSEAALRYRRQKNSWNLADYTDLLEFWLEKIQTGIYPCPHTQILVDEVQDLSNLQLAVVTALAAGEGKSLFAIGDPNQSIYGFRGALSDPAGYLQKIWPDLVKITLTENYRSSQAILDLSAAALPGAPKLTAVSSSGAPADNTQEIHIFQAPTAIREASWVAERVKALLGGSSLSLTKSSQQSLSPGDVAVLVRFQGLFGPLQRALETLGVPCCVPESEAFWSDPRVKAILGAGSRFLGMAGLDGATPIACPDRVLAKGPLELATYLRDTPPFDRLFWQSPAFRQLCAAYVEHKGWAGLISFVAMQSELELVAAKAEKVQIMSLHAAKGLEFEAVFLPALEDGVLPFAGSGFLTGKAGASETMPDEDEELRLFYVGLSRAKKKLYLSYSAKREIFGRLLMLKASRFLKNLPLGAVKRSTLKAHNVRREKQLDLLK